MNSKDLKAWHRNQNGLGTLFGYFSIESTHSKKPLLTLEDIGRVVTLTDSATVGLGRPGDRIVGVLRDIRDDYAVVQIAGLALVNIDSIDPLYVGGPVAVGGRGGVVCTSSAYSSALFSYDEIDKKGIIKI